MADLKSERLINLTLALLSVTRYLKKQEIFKVVEGYSGSFESMDRMFERDKADLRNLGIEIEVGEVDPLFEDEPGYRIRESDYYLNLPKLSSSELALIAMASEMWRIEGRNSEVQSFVTKMHSLGIPTDRGNQQPVNFQLRSLPRYFDSIQKALTESRVLKFHYRQDPKVRVIEPYRLFVWQGSWYLIGLDVNLSEIRTFKLDRIKELVEIGKEDSQFQVPTDFKVNDHLPSEVELEKVIIRVTKGEANLIRSMGIIVDSNENFDDIEISFNSSRAILNVILWHGSSVEVLSPPELRDEISKSLSELLRG